MTERTTPSCSLSGGSVGNKGSVQTSGRWAGGYASAAAAAVSPSAGLTAQRHVLSHVTFEPTSQKPTSLNLNGKIGCVYLSEASLYVCLGVMHMPWGFLLLYINIYGGNLVLQGQLLGCALLAPLGRTADGTVTAEVAAFCIAPEHRGSGRGDSLLGFLGGSLLQGLKAVGTGLFQACCRSATNSESAQCSMISLHAIRSPHEGSHYVVPCLCMRMPRTKPGY